MVCHNTPREWQSLGAAIRCLGLGFLEIHWECALARVREICPEMSSSKSLGHLPRLLGLDNDTLHRAPVDAELTLLFLEALHSWGQVKATLRGEDLLVYLTGLLRGDGSAEVIRYNQDRILRQARWAQAVLPSATHAVPMPTLRT